MPKRQPSTLTERIGSRIVSWLWNVAYVGVLLVASPWILWAVVRKGKYRQGLGEKFLGLVAHPSSMLRQDRDHTFTVWLHAVSVGEVNLLAGTLHELTQRHPSWKIVVSSGTKTGHTLAVKKYADLAQIIYCPLDFSWAVRRAIGRIKPDLLLLAELELWPNLIALAKQSGARVGIINGRLSDSSFRGYRQLRWLVSQSLQELDLIACQDRATADRFLKLGALNASVIVTGSLKYDGAQTSRQHPAVQALADWARFKPEDQVWLVGSTQAPEEAIALSIYERLRGDFPSLRMVLVPRHPERFDEVARLVKQRCLPLRRRSNSAGDQSTSTEPTCTESPVILVDTIGELGAWWGTAQIGFVGGSFGDRGGQNMIEPAAYGVATSFGPNTKNFRDIVAALLAVDGALVVQDESALEAFVRRCLSEPSHASQLGVAAKHFVASQLGATERTLNAVEILVGASLKEPKPKAESQHAA